MFSNSFWIFGNSRSGKSTRLVEQFCQWSQTVKPLSPKFSRRQSELHKLAGQRVPAILVLAANSNNRLKLADHIANATSGKHSFHSTTPLGFFEDEVVLFWPLLIQSLDLRAQFPLRLRPETEQELAAQLWSQELDEVLLRQAGIGIERMVRRILDLFQLAALSATPFEEIPTILERGFIDDTTPGSFWPLIGELLTQWRSWCLARGLLTYGIICELYWRYLLNDRTYQQHLAYRYQAVIADDVDEYPAISRHLFEFLLDRGAVGAFTYNPDGGTRLGLGADPEYMANLQKRCSVERLNRPSGLAAKIGTVFVELALGPEGIRESAEENFSLPQSPYPLAPDSVKSIQTISRADLLRKTAEAIIELVQSKTAAPQEIAVIAPGLDAIARYSLIEILTSHHIPTESLNDQRPLSSSPTIRALLTLLALVYPGLGRLVDRDKVAEMLIILSQPIETKEEGRRKKEEGKTKSPPLPLSPSPPFPLPISHIDPVRAGLIADHCFYPDTENPRLLQANTFPRWDRLGHRATTAYQEIWEWIEQQRSHQQQHLLPNPIALLDRAIQKFLLKDRELPYHQLAALRELIETAVHYWEIDRRLQGKPSPYSQSATVAQFIQLLRRGTITANPFPLRTTGRDSNAVTLANIFQYRNHRQAHKWHFWLDAGSHLWMSGGAANLFAAPLFLQQGSWSPTQIEAEQEADRQRLRRILLDLLSRCSSLCLCHSELAANGQEQVGPLIPLIYTSIPRSGSATLRDRQN
ncbi:hypothetical protein BCD67_05285 [Oscillatoriales cyanobacterium USR001]|nr:hypothetical protein BCD67_05285 [Oscillatoriales cyanobacterium USR001]